MQSSRNYCDYALLGIALSLLIALASASRSIIARYHFTVRWLLNDPVGFLSSPADTGSTIWQLALLAGAGMGLALWSLASVIVVEIALFANRWGAPIRMGDFAVSNLVSPLVRRLILRRVATATTVATIGLGAPAIAVEPPDHIGWPVTTPSTGVTTVISSSDPAPNTAGTDSGAVDSWYTVRPGDCLWSIAAHRLHTDTPTRIDAYWREIYRLNQSIIGTQPGHIIPGTLLQLPEGEF